MYCAFKFWISRNSGLAQQPTPQARQSKVLCQWRTSGAAQPGGMRPSMLVTRALSARVRTRLQATQSWCSLAVRGRLGEGLVTGPHGWPPPLAVN